MRDYSKLEVFQLADLLTLAVYRATKQFPNDEKYGLTSQVRRAAVSVAANIAEGSAKSSRVDFARSLQIALGSAFELNYELSLAARLGYLAASQYEELEQLSQRTWRALRKFICAINNM